MSPLDATTVRGLTREEAFSRLATCQAEAALLTAHLAMGAAVEAEPDALIGVREAARKLGVSRATLYAKREQFPWSTFFVASPGDVKCHAGRIAEYLRDPDGYGVQRSGLRSVRGR